MREIYAVREELEVMAVRIILFPVTSRDIGYPVELQPEHGEAVAASDLLTMFYSNLRINRVLFGFRGNACLIETVDRLAQKVHTIRLSAKCVTAIRSHAAR